MSSAAIYETATSIRTSPPACTARAARPSRAGTSATTASGPIPPTSTRARIEGELRSSELAAFLDLLAFKEQRAEFVLQRCRANVRELLAGGT